MFEGTISPVRHRLQAAGVQRLGIFGSVARGEENDASDVDVLVTFRPDARTFDNLFAVGEALEQRPDPVRRAVLSFHRFPPFRLVRSG